MKKTSIFYNQFYIHNYFENHLQTELHNNNVRIGNIYNQPQDVLETKIEFLIEDYIK